MVNWYLAILCGVVLNMEKSEKRFFFPFESAYENWVG